MKCPSIAKGNAPIYDNKDKEFKGLKQPLMKYAGYFGKGLENFLNHSKYTIISKIIILGFLFFSYFSNAETIFYHENIICTSTTRGECNSLRIKVFCNFCTYKNMLLLNNQKKKLLLSQ